MGLQVFKNNSRIARQSEERWAKTGASGKYKHLNVREQNLVVSLRFKSAGVRDLMFKCALNYLASESSHPRPHPSLKTEFKINSGITLNCFLIYMYMHSVVIFC